MSIAYLKGLIEAMPRFLAHPVFQFYGVVLEALEEHRERQQEARMKECANWKEKGLFFCYIYGSFLNPGTVWSVYKKLLKETALPDMRFHDLRHVLLEQLQEIVDKMGDLFKRPCP